LILLPLAAVIILFAVANRQTISVSFDPFSNPDASSAFVTAPLFLLLFLTLIVGVIVGGLATWVTQGTNRRAARAARDEADRWRDEAERLRREPPIVAPRTGQALARSDF
jgi:uncharacterized integral membrane protein